MNSFLPSRHRLGPVFFLWIIFLWTIAQAGLFAETVERAPWQSRLAGPSLAWTSADFDGDHRTDWVSASQSSKTQDYDLVFWSGEHADWQPLTYSHWAAQRLEASDVDGDHDADLVLKTFTSQPLAVWLNDGAGHFERGDLKDYPALRLSRDPKDLSAGPMPSALDQISEEAGSNVLAPSARNFAPGLVLSFFTIGHQATPGTPQTAGFGARGPPSHS